MAEKSECVAAFMALGLRVVRGEVFAVKVETAGVDAEPVHDGLSPAEVAHVLDASPP
jgi:hypothetical protein